MKRLLLLYKNPFCILGFITILFSGKYFSKDMFLSVIYYLRV